MSCPQATVGRFLEVQKSQGHPLSAPLASFSLPFSYLSHQGSLISAILEADDHPGNKAMETRSLSIVFHPSYPTSAAFVHSDKSVNSGRWILKIILSNIQRLAHWNHVLPCPLSVCSSRIRAFLSLSKHFPAVKNKKNLCKSKCPSMQQLLTSWFQVSVHGPQMPSFQVSEGLTFHVLTTAVSSSPGHSQKHPPNLIIHYLESRNKQRT